MTEQPATISYAEFSRLNLRIGTIKAADRVPKTDRLVRMDVDLGSETRQVVAGIGAHYEPEALVGSQVVILANLEPATLRGVRSDGMLLAAEEEGRIVIIRPEGSVRPGSSVK